MPVRQLLFLAKSNGSDVQTVSEWWTDLNPWWQSGIILLGGFLLHLFIRVFVLRALQRLADGTENDLDDRLLHFIKRFYIIVLLFVLVILILKSNGVEITPLLASAGIAGIAIGLAAKETLADILAGVFLVVDRPIRIGDRVKIDRIGTHWGSWGDVVDIGLRRTRIRNTDGVIVNYPNNVLANSVITNFSFEDVPVRVRVRFQVNYDANLEHVMEVARGAIGEAEGVMPGTVDMVVRSLWDDDGGHSQSGILVEGRYKIERIRERTQIRSRVLRSLSTALRGAGISFAQAEFKVAGLAS